MSSYFPASEVILRHQAEFSTMELLFAGELQDNLACNFNLNQLCAFTTQYHHWRAFNAILAERAQFGLSINNDLITHQPTLIYFWPKNKLEAKFQLLQLLSCYQPGSQFFVVGENRSGVRSVEKLFSPYCSVKKIDSARRCSLYVLQLQQAILFSLHEWWLCYRVNHINVKSLPGVFSHGHGDPGSQLLLESILTPIRGDVLDIGCGSGLLGASLCYQNEQIDSLTLSDTNAAALISAQATLAENHIKGNVIASDVYSDLPRKQKFDVIVSNPPFHEGINTDISMVEKLITQAPDHLKCNGKLYLVANAFLPYADLLDHTFGAHKVINKTNQFKVYLAELKR